MRRLVPIIAMVLTMMVALVPSPRPAMASAADPVPATGSTLSLPDPTGRYRVGTVSLHLVDASRRDPWVPSISHPLRELMTQLWYPAARTKGYEPARYMPPLAGRHLEAVTEQAFQTRVPAGSFHDLRTHSYQGAPIARRPSGDWPVILFSPGDGMDRSSLTAVAEELAGHGFVVVGIDHTYDSGEVEFPGGRLEVGGIIPPESADQETLVRTADARFVLDQVTRLNRGIDPDAERRRLPSFRGALDLSRVGMFGHSHGGEATAETMLQDGRVTAGASLDGGVSERVAAAGLRSPFMVISGNSAAGHPMTEANLPALWPRLTGWNRWLRLRGAGHLAFTDFVAFAPALGTPPELRQALFGTLAPERAIAIERTYLLAFFTQHLDRRDQPILDGPSPRYPEIAFER